MPPKSSRTGANGTNSKSTTTPRGGGNVNVNVNNVKNVTTPRQQKKN